MADNLNPVWQNTDLDRFAYIVAFVVYCVAKTLFNSGIRIVEKAICFCAVGTFDYLFCNDSIVDI